MKIVMGLVSLAAAIIAGAMALGVVYPPAAAAACPACYRMAAAAPGVFVDKDATPPETALAVETVDEARGRVRRFYGKSRALRQGGAPRFSMDDRQCQAEGRSRIAVGAFRRRAL